MYARFAVRPQFCFKIRIFVWLFLKEWYISALWGKVKASHCTVQVCNWTLFDLIQIMNVFRRHSRQCCLRPAAESWCAGWVCLIGGSSDRDPHKVCQTQQHSVAIRGNSPNPCHLPPRLPRPLRPSICCGSTIQCKACPRLIKIDRQQCNNYPIICNSRATPSRPKNPMAPPP